MKIDAKFLREHHREIVGPKLFSEGNTRKRDVKAYYQLITRMAGDYPIGVFMNLIELLLYHDEEIFTKDNLELLKYRRITLKIGRKEYPLQPDMAAIVKGIYEKSWQKNDVLYDISQLLSHDDELQLELKARVYNHLLAEKYIKVS